MFSKCVNVLHSVTLAFFELKKLEVNLSWHRLVLEG